MKSGKGLCPKVYTSFGFASGELLRLVQRNLQVQRSLVRVVTENKEVETKNCRRHMLNVSTKLKIDNLIISPSIFLYL